MGRTTSSPPGAVSSSPRSSARPSDGLHVERSPAAAVDATYAELGGPVAGGDQPLGAAEQRLEVDVPDPRDVLAVRDRVVQRDEQQRGRAALQQRVDDLVRTGGVLDQQHEHRLVARRDALEAAEGGAEALEPVPDLLERRAEAWASAAAPSAL